MNHKRGRAKNQRGGCLLCKPHKANGCEIERSGVARRMQDAIADLVVEAAAEREPMTCDGFGCAFCNDDEYDATLLGYVPLAAPLLDLERVA